MKKILITVCIIILSYNLQAGRYAGDFMAIGSGVRALGMGGAYSAIADDGSAIYWNASGISQIKEIEFTLMRAFLYEGLAYYDNFNMCYPLPNEVTLGFNWTRLTIDDVPIYSESHLVGTNIDQRAAFEEFQLTAIPDGKFKSTDDLFQFAFSKHFKQTVDLGWFLFDLPIDYYLGANFKYIRRKMMGYIGDGTGFDFSFMAKTNLGILTDVEWLGDISWSLNLQDISNTTLTWDVESRHKDEILFNTKLGLAYFQPINSLDSKLILAFSKDFIYEKIDYFGLAWQYKNFTELRLGWYDQNFSTGIGIELYNIKLDYAFLTNNLGNTNRIGLGFKF
ncbi:MAG: hypothetical protein PHY08_00165 [Candidatus Cloacimonetes bacterium]|nr:hypothetical protein [Candidatus Cloacimonadota bacterium]MDD4154971.1 hypothetical protein [Candidatus Cloacimonadota bacterium]